MKLTHRIREFVVQNCPNVILQPVMRWRQRRILGRIANTPREEVFTEIFNAGTWGGDSKSGVGSEFARTAVIRQELPGLLQRRGVKSILDLPCGDFNWMQHVDLGHIKYIGGDIVAALIAENQCRYGSDQREFVQLDLVKDSLPRADLIMVRDCFIHLSFADIQAAIGNIVCGEFQYLLTTTYPRKRRHYDTVTGGFRAINLQLPPFGFPPPLEMILEEPQRLSSGLHGDRSLALWRVSDLPRA